MYPYQVQGKQFGARVLGANHKEEHILNDIK